MKRKETFENFFNEEESNGMIGKIPYDDVPIQRGGYRHSERRLSYEEPKTAPRRIHVSSSRPIVIAYIFIVLLILSNIVIGAFLYKFSTSANLSGDINVVNYTGDIYSSNPDMQIASSRAYMSTCSVLATSSALSSMTENEFATHDGSGGSGIIFDIDRQNGKLYIVTNYHVIYNLNTYKFYSYIYVLLPDMNTPILMKVVGGSINYDVAVLKSVDEQASTVKLSTCTSVVFADSNEIYLGEPVIAAGNSRAAGLQITSGIISLEEEVMSGKIAGKEVNLLLLRHSAEINGGNSGGGLFNASGKLVGLVNGRYSAGSGSTVYSSENVIQGMNYAIPSSLVSSIANNIINDSIINTAASNASLQRPDIGLFSVKIKYGISCEKNIEFKSKRFNLSNDSSLQINYTTVIKDVTESSPFKTGDVIIGFKYQDKIVTCNKMFTLESHIYNFRNGDNVTFYVERTGVPGVLEINVSISTFIAIA